MNCGWNLSSSYSTIWSLTPFEEISVKNNNNFTKHLHTALQMMSGWNLSSSYSTTWRSTPFEKISGKNKYNFAISHKHAGWNLSSSYLAFDTISITNFENIFCITEIGIYLYSTTCRVTPFDKIRGKYK